MMQIKMLRNARGSEDGYTVKHYEADKEYEVKAELGSVFVRNNDAERLGGDELVEVGSTEDVAPAKPMGAKSVGGAPENKDLGKAPKNKAPAMQKGGTPVYLPGKLYEIDGVVCIAAAQTPGGEVGLLPVDQLPEGERKSLVDEGKLTADGKIAA